jgi:stearoyl-CoA desaturase (Delta-9 desaturase)
MPELEAAAEIGLRPQQQSGRSSRHMLPAHRFKSRQRWHFLLCVALPTFLALTLPWFLPESWLSLKGILLWWVMWFLVGGIGVSVGLHRHFSHRAFKATPVLRSAMAILGCMACQGTVGYWVALHRSHHSHSDQPGDSHSPVPSAQGTSSEWKAFWRGHIGWVWQHDVPSPVRYAADLMRDPLIVRIDRNYWWSVAAGVVVPGLVGIWMWDGWSGFWAGAFWGGFLRIALGHHIIWAINSVCHFSGQRPYDTDDQSRNVPWLAILSFGESWHNNHHQAPTSASFKHRWWQSDFGLGFIRWVELLGLISDVKQHQK